MLLVGNEKMNMLSEIAKNQIFELHNRLHQKFYFGKNVTLAISKIDNANQLIEEKIYYEFGTISFGLSWGRTWVEDVNSKIIYLFSSYDMTNFQFINTNDFEFELFEGKTRLLFFFQN